MPSVEGDIVVDFPRRPRPWRPVLLGCGMVLATAAAWLPLVANGGPRDDAQLIANATTDGTQQSPKLASLPGGKLVVVWAGQGADDDSGIFARIRDPQTGFGPEFRVNETADGDQVEPAVAADNAGNFLVAWTGPSQAVDAQGAAIPDRGTDVFTRMFDATGTPLRGEQRLNQSIPGDQSQPAVAALTTRRFAVVFAGAGQASPAVPNTTVSDDQGIWLGTTGDTTDGYELLANQSHSQGAQQHPAAAYDGTDLLVAWDGAGPGDDEGVFAALSTGALVFPAAFRLNVTTDGHQGDPAVAAKSGGFLVAWAGQSLADSAGILLTQVADGQTQTGAEIPVNNLTDGDQGHPAVAVSGSFVGIAWDGAGGVDDSGVQARRWNFSVSLQPAADQFAVNTTTTGVEQHPALAANADGDYTVAFEGPGTDVDIFVRHYAFNDPPVVVDDFYTTNEDTPATGNVLANDSDPDGDTITVTQVTGSDSGPDNGSVTLNGNGTFTYTPFSNYHGSDHFSYRASDGTADSVRVANVTITIISVNDGGPTANPDGPFAATERVTLTVTDPARGVLANDTDPDNDVLTARLRSNPTSGAVSLSPDGTFSYTGGDHFCGDDYFSYVAFDGYIESAPARATIHVNCVHSPAEARDDQYSTVEDAELSVPATGVLQNDFHEQDDPIVAQLRDPPAHGTVTLNEDGSFDYRPNANFNGTDTFTYAAVETNPPPPPSSSSSASPLAGDLNHALGDVTQTVGDVTSAAAPSSSSTSTTTTTTTAPPASPPAPSIAHVTISVGAAEDAPLAGDDAEFTPEDTPLVVAAPGVLINDTDPDNGQLTARLDTPPSQGRLEAFNSDGSFTYQPYHNTTGSDLFTYEAKNQEGKTAIGRVRVLIGPQGDIVLATDDRYEVREDASLTVPAPGVLSNDVDPDGERSKLAVTVTRQPTHGTLEMNQNGSFLYAPAHDYSGLDGFGYQIEDPDHNKATANVVITVTNSSEGPTETTPTTLPGPATTAPPTGPTSDVAVVTHNPTPQSAAPAAVAPVTPITVPTTAPPPPTVAVLPARHGKGKFPVVPVGAGAAGALGLAGLGGGLRSRRRNALGPIEHTPL